MHPSHTRSHRQTPHLRISNQFYAARGRNAHNVRGGARSARPASPRPLPSRINSTLRAVETRIMCTGVPADATNSSKAANAEVSALAGIPGKPKRTDTAPSRATPFPAKVRSHGHKATDLPKGWIYSSKRLTRAGLDSGKPSAKPTTAEETSSPNSAICCPLTPAVSAPQKYKRGPPGDNLRICCCNNAKPAKLSTGGEVSGKIASRVKPPAAAACIKDSRVSRSSKPGSPLWL